MNSTQIKDALAITASVCTVLQFLAGTLVCRKIIKSGTTGHSSPLPFLMCYTSCLLWLRYGMLIGDYFICLVNVFGSILQAAYIIVFIVYSVKKHRKIKQMLAANCSIAPVYLYSFYEEDKLFAANYIGLISCTVTVLFFASPLKMLPHVIRVKCTESLPFPVITASLVVSCQWFAYGCLVNDRFIQIPNFLGSVLSAFQLCLFLVYRNDRAEQTQLV